MVNTTVKLNVGGRHYEISSELIEKFPDSVLSTLVSDCQDPTESVFIDRNGDTFAYVLDFMRYGSIDLPVTVSKSMFNRDLGFYGISSEEPINQESLTEVVSSFHHTKVEHDMFFLAFEAYYQYGIKKSQTLEYVQVSISGNHKLYDTSGIGPEGKSLFENYLDKYFGLKVCMGGQTANNPMREATRCGSFYVCAKEE